MIDQTAVRIAVVADTSLQRHILQQFLSKQGYQVVLNSDPQQLAIERLQACETDLWLYDAICEDETECTALEYFLTESSAPVLFGEGAAPARDSEEFPRWERALLKKILQLTESVTSLCIPTEQPGDEARTQVIALPHHFVKTGAPSDQPAQQVWLLAASLGGPQAVKAFLDVLPKGLPVGFMYAQHIDANFEGSLPQAVGRHSQWPVRLLTDHHFVREGEVVVVPVERVLTFTESKRLQTLDTAWDGPYSPSIEQMMHNLAQHYGAHCGVIVFSGMGSDGSLAVEYMYQQGAQVWTQSADSCVCSSMPDSVRELGLSRLSGTPQDLAKELVQYLLATQNQQHNNDLKRIRQ